MKSWSEFEFLPRALEALAELHQSEARVVVITNQPAVGRGLLGEQDLSSIHQRMLGEIQAAGGHVEAIYTCPHTHETGCACRKPGIDLFKRASADLGLQLRGAYMVGDSWTDVQAALSVDAMPILIAQDPAPSSTESLIPVVNDLYEATALLLFVGRKLEPPQR